MQEKFKKVAAGAVGLLTAGATLATGFAGVAFGTDLSDFAAGNVFTTANTIVVVGPNAAMADNVGAINIGAKLAQAGATYTGSSAVATAPGIVSLDTANTRIYKGSNINVAKETITKDDLSTLLASGTMVDADDTSYTIDQYITVGTSAALNFTNADDSALDPRMKVLYGTAYTNPLYTLKASFETIPINNSVGKKLTLFGKEFTVSSDTTTTKLYLYGSATDVSLNRGDTSTVTIAGVENTIRLVAVTGGTTDKVTLEINGVTDDINEGQSKKINGVSIYADRVSAYQEVVDGVALNSGSAKLLVGSQKLVFEDGAAVQTGDSTLSDIDGTYVKVNGGSGVFNELSTLEVIVYGENDENKVVKAGESLVDPVFGNLKFSFAGLTPAEDDSATTTTKVTRSTKEGKVTFTDRNDVEKTITFAYDTTVDTTKDAALQYDSDSKIATYEGETLAKDDYVVLNTNRYSHLFKVTKIQNKTSTTTRYVTLNDIYASTNYDVEIDATGAGTKVIDGATYTFQTSGCTSYTCTGVTIADPTTGTTIFPLLIGKNGEGIAFTNETNALAVVQGTNFDLPSGSLTSTLDAFGNLTLTDDDANTNTIAFRAADGDAQKTITVGKVDYNVTFDQSANTTAFKLHSATNSPAVLFYAYDKNVDVTTTDLIHYVIAAETDAAATAKFEIIKPKYATTATNTYKSAAYTSDEKSLQSDTDKTQLVDRYGTSIVYDSSSEAEFAELKYPASQVYANLYFMEVEQSAPDATSSQNIQYASLTTDGIARMTSDASVAADKLEKNVILVGGPAINSLVAELAAAEKTPDVTYYRDETKAGSLMGKALIQVIDNAFADGNVAIVVSGYEAAQTRAASLKLSTGALSGTAVELEGSEVSAYDFEAYKEANAAAVVEDEEEELVE